MIAAGDTRPVIVLTHVPLHHTRRDSGGDNLYSSYIFDVLNQAAKTLDIIFLFGHNHSSSYDDYIGGSVNLLAPGDEIRLPDRANKSTSTYLTQTLAFTYANCGYVGYSGNGVSDTSTNALTVGCIRLTENSIRFVRYSENGLYSIDYIARKNPGTANASPEKTTLQNSGVFGFISAILERFAFLIRFYFAFFLS